MSGEHTWSHARAAGVRWSIMAALGVVGLLAGCFADSTGGGGSGSAGGSAERPYGSSSSGGAATQPLVVVDVDTGGTLVTTPGNGIGVYVEYQSGGHWRVSWTCDSSLTNLSCSLRRRRHRRDGDDREPRQRRSPGRRLALAGQPKADRGRDDHDDG